MGVQRSRATQPDVSSLHPSLDRLLLLPPSLLTGFMQVFNYTSHFDANLFRAADMLSLPWSIVLRLLCCRSWDYRVSFIPLIMHPLLANLFLTSAVRHTGSQRATFARAPTFLRPSCYTDFHPYFVRSFSLFSLSLSFVSLTRPPLGSLTSTAPKPGSAARPP
jgi:hypothetical protein